MASFPMVYNSLPGYAGFTAFTPTIPKLYWDVYSQEERIKRICEELHKLCEYANAMNVNINLNHDMIEALRADFEKFKESGFFDYYAEQIQKWINDNLATVMQMLIKQVYFGLTLDGHFVAYVPESWNDVVFDTGADYTLDTYGRLILRWDADSPYNVEQTPEVVRPYSDEILEQKVRNIMYTLYSVS